MISPCSDIVAAKLTSDNKDDRMPARELSRELLDKHYADKGYVSKALIADLKDDGITLITTHCKNMKAKVLGRMGQSYVV
ncbi:transposase [Photobacterium damselae]